MGAGFHGGFGGTKGSTTSKFADNEEKSTSVLSEQDLVAELEKKGVKFTKARLKALRDMNRCLR